MTARGTAVGCPICGCDWTGQQPRGCVCGYDFDTGDATQALRALEVEKRAADRRWLGGLAVFVSTGVTIALAAMSPTLLLVAPIVVVIQVFGGLGLTASGLARGIRVGKKLARAKQARQLPEARLLR